MKSSYEKFSSVPNFDKGNSLTDFFPEHSKKRKQLSVFSRDQPAPTRRRKKTESSVLGESSYELTDAIEGYLVVMRR
jgi:hypothetical protein